MDPSRRGFVLKILSAGAVLTVADNAWSFDPTTKAVTLDASDGHVPLAFEYDSDEAMQHVNVSNARISTSTGHQTLQEALNQRVIHVDAIANLQELRSLSLRKGQLVEVGGTEFRWDGSSFVAIGTVYAESFGAIGDGITDDRAAIQAALDMTGRVRLIPGATYAVSSTLYIRDGQELFSDHPGNKATIKLIDPVFKGSILETVGFRTTAVNNIRLENLVLYGNLNDQPVGVGNVAGGEGVGLAATCGRSNIVEVRATRTAGVGMWFSNGGNKSLYTHGNNLHVVATYTGQEGIIFDGGWDQRIRYCESYWPWDGFRDYDYTQDKVSKAVDANICAGVLFYRGSAEVVEMHPNNNRHGYAWATFGKAGSAYRLRFDHAIGESSAGGVYLAPTDDVSGGLLNCHSTRGKYGLPLLKVRSIANVHIATVNVKVDVTGGYPSKGTYRAVDIDGDRCVISDLRIWATNGKINDCALSIRGNDHTIRGSISNFPTKEDGTPALALWLDYPVFTSNVTLKITGCGIGVKGASQNEDPGILDLTFSNTDTDIDPAYLRFLSNATLARSRIENLSTGCSSRDRTLSTTVAAVHADDTMRTVSIPHSGMFYKVPLAKAFYVTNTGNADYNVDAVKVWLSDVTDTDFIVKYRISEDIGDFAIRVNGGY
ncbi:pectate lyase family protein [Modicisalibacter luteus]|uniref:Pectate lyase superfamily protein domain-containing protein n=1 Tax=Modicisalibacter luteus TaxID=453962 RepID=A0ABV7M070_9GAMM|nr:hypothetical protein [Halomonas lutea]GHA97100.1 hypothetical protein GCM10007159_18550 [Halomonas lutea]